VHYLNWVIKASKGSNDSFVFDEKSYQRFYPVVELQWAMGNGQ